MKTPEEIKKGLERCKNNAHCDSCMSAYHCQLESDALAYIKQLEGERNAVVLDHLYESGFMAGFKAAHPKWISVEDSLPDREGEYIVIVQLPDGKQERMWDIFHPYKGWCEDSGDGKIVYWMSFDSLPEPQKEG